MQNTKDTEDLVAQKTETTIKMANAAGVTAETASDQLTAVWNNFYDGSKSLEYYADVLVRLGADTASSTDEISEGMQQFAAVADTVGLSYEYAASALATVTATTRESANTVGNAFRTIFARLEGLKLGETLDDGTTLNKYSTALKAVGVNIFDSNNELKNMDTLLDETAVKWQTLNKDQQVALAQTVAGVQQYTRFVALMDNWDFMEQNLEAAYGSTGSLEEQAEIYAESWEAARDRVTAAAEDVYDSLINADFFIGLDDAFTPILTGLATMIDSVGGLNGVLAVSALLMNKVFGDKIAASLTNMAASIGFTQTAEAKRATAVKQQAIAEAQNLSARQRWVSEDSNEYRVLEVQKQIVNFQGQAAEKAATLNERQKDILQTDVERVKYLGQQVEQQSQLNDLRANEAMGAIEDLAEFLPDDEDEETVMSQFSSNNGIRSKNTAARNTLTGDEDSAEAYEKLTNALKAASSQEAKLNAVLRETQTGLADADQRAIELAKSLGLIGKNSSGTEFLQQLQTKSEGAKKQITELKAALTALFNPQGDNKIQIKLDALFDKIITKTGQAEEAISTMSTRTQEMQATMSRALDNPDLGKLNWAEKLVEVGNALSHISILISSIQSLGRVFTDEDMSTGERFATAMMSISMIIPSVAGTIKSLKAALDGLTLSYIKNTAAAVANRMAQVANGTFRETTGDATVDFYEELYQQEYNNIGNIEAQVVTRGQKIKNVLTYLGSNILKFFTTTAGKFTLVGAGITVASLAIVKGVEYYNRYAIAADEAAEHAQAMAEVASDVSENLTSIENAVSGYDSAVEALNACTRGTEEWNDALVEVKSQVTSLLKEYPELLKQANLYDEDGLLNEDVVENFVKQAQESANAADAASLIAQAKLSEASLQNDIVNTGRHSGNRNQYTVESDLEKVMAQYNGATLGLTDIYNAIGQVGEKSANGAEITEDYAESLLALAQTSIEASNQMDNAAQTIINSWADTNDKELADGQSKLMSGIYTSAVEAMEQAAAQASKENNKADRSDKSSLTDESFKGTSYENLSLVDAYIKATGLNWRADSNAVRGTEGAREYAFLDENGEEQTIDADTVTSIVAAAAAEEKLAEAATLSAEALRNVGINASEGIAEGIKEYFNTGNLESLTQGEAKELNEATDNGKNTKDYLTSITGKTDKELQEMLGENYVKQFNQALDNVNTAFGSFIDGFTTSVKKSFEALNDEGELSALSLEGQKAIAEILKNALANETLKEVQGDIESLDPDSLQGFSDVLVGMDWSTAEPEDFVNALEEAGVETGWTTEKIIAFAEAVSSDDLITGLDTIAENYKTQKDILEGLEQGDTIEDADYASLDEALQQYFVKTLDGTYQLVGVADELLEKLRGMTIEEAASDSDKYQEQINNLQDLQGEGYDLEDLSTKMYYSGSMEGQEGLAQQLQILEAMEGTTERVVEWRDKLNNQDISYDDSIDILNAVQEYSEELDNLPGKIEEVKNAQYENDMAILSTAENLKELSDLIESGVINSAEAATDAVANMREQIDEDVDTDELDSLTKILQGLAEESEGVETGGEGISEVLKDDEKAAKRTAEAILRYDSAVEDVVDNYEDWMKALKSDNLQDQADVIDDITNAYGDLLDIDASVLSDDFLTNTDNLNLMKRAIEGSEDAYNQLAAAANEDILAHCDLDTTAFDAAANEVINYMNDINFQDIEVGASLDNTSFLQSLTDMVNAANMTQAQATAFLANMGIDAHLKTVEKEEPVTKTVNSLEPEISYDTVTNPTIAGDGTIEETTVQVPKIHYNAVPEQVTDINASGGFALEVTSANKGSGGNFKYSNSSNASGNKKKSSGGSGGSGGGGGGGSSNPAKAVKRTKKVDMVDRYHEIDDAIDNVTRAVDKLSTSEDRLYGKDKLNKMDEEISKLRQQAELIKQKRQEAENYLKTEDRTNLDEASAALGVTLKYDEETGDILNLEEIENKLWEVKRSMEDTKAAMSTQEAQDEYDESTLDPWQTKYDDWKDYVDQYEETKELIQDLAEEEAEQLREALDKELEKITYKFEVVIDLKDAEKDIREMQKTMQEGLGDAITQWSSDLEKTFAELDYQNALTEGLKLGDYNEEFTKLMEMYNSTEDEVNRASIMEEISSLIDSTIGSVEELTEWLDGLEDYIPDIVDAASDRLDEFFDQLDHNDTILDSIKELYALQGVTYKTQDGFNRLQRVSQEKLDGQIATAKLQRKWYEEQAALYEQAAQRLNDFVANGGKETDIEYDTLKKAADAYLEQMNEAQEAWLSAAQEGMETLQEMYEEQINRAVETYSKAVTDGLGLDLAQDKYDHYIEKEERYLDAVNEAYEKASWYNKLQADIDKTTDKVYASKLKALQEEIDLRAEGNTLSEYDLDILNAKYEVLQAQQALEEAKNNATNLELVRDQQGNWNYQYTNDPDDVADAEQNLLDAQNEWYNLAKDQTTDLTEQIIDTQQEFAEAIQEIYQNAKDGVYATDEDFQNALEEATDYYMEKMEYLYEEQNLAMEDMTEAGGETIQDFENVYADTLQQMTGDMGDWESSAQEFLAECEITWQNYSSNLNSIAGETGTTLNDLANQTDIVSKSNDELEATGEETIDMLAEMINSVDETTMRYLEFASSVDQTRQALASLAAQMTATQNAASGLGFDYSLDYNALYNNATSDTDRATYLASRDYKIKNSTDEEIKAWGTTFSNELMAAFNAAGNSMSGSDWKNMSESEQLALLEQYGISKSLAGYATGGYTGDFDGGKLAFLHEKELVLNQEDTENILAAVEVMRAFTPDWLQSVEKSIDNNVIAAMGLLSESVSATQVALPQSELEQNVHIEANFPNATSSDEIKSALVSLVDDAAQWVNRRTS